MLQALASLGTVCKALCGVAAGSTRAAISQHFATSNNVSGKSRTLASAHLIWRRRCRCVYLDVSAKEGTQETAVTLVGLVLGLWAVDILGIPRKQFVCLLS